MVALTRWFGHCWIELLTILRFILTDCDLVVLDLGLPSFRQQICVPSTDDEFLG